MKTYLTILEELGWPKIYLVSARQFEKVDGDYLYKKDPDGSEYSGFAADSAPIITLHYNLRGKVLKNTIYHEIIHILQPWRKHWWVECAAELLAGGGGRGYYSKKYNHYPEELGTREQVLHLLQLAVVRFNAQ